MKPWDIDGIVNLKPAFDMDEWKSWKYWLDQDPEYCEEVWDKLLVMLEFLHVTPVTYWDFNELRGLLFIPFGGPRLWNRRVSLILREMELANDKHFGGWDEEEEDILSREWSLSGLDRPVFTHRRGELGDGGDTPDLPDDDVEADEVLVE